MPRFLCYCPDHPDHLEKRMAVRPEHLERVTKEKQDGTQGELPSSNICRGWWRVS